MLYGILEHPDWCFKHLVSLQTLIQYFHIFIDRNPQIKTRGLAGMAAAGTGTVFKVVPAVTPVANPSDTIVPSISHPFRPELSFCRSPPLSTLLLSIQISFHFLLSFAL